MNDVRFPVQRVLDGIDAAAAAGLPVKVNMVVQRGVNDDSIADMAERFRGTGTILRFIEYMDVGTTNGWQLEDVVPAAEIVARGRRSGGRSSRSQPNYPGEVASRYRYADGAGRDRRDRLGHPALLRRLHAGPPVGRGRALHLPVRGARHRPAGAAARGRRRRGAGAR